MAYVGLKTLKQNACSLMYSLEYKTRKVFPTVLSEKSGEELPNNSAPS